ncbi:DUF6455 family protein [Rhodovulum adriaticum]|uniref:DUF6455 domain-containing protein n=1 Tax=Rhodovulum adriaticum TaxID=35804 RepID=A0A4R2NXR9_RHOAD|nr:DUF6455 family protein [Rhodovulum adriaticum]MBK1636409.1 hypothetical protein [Rhodovulum adriaticum]TCP26464.1 hypothetical protein EV656_102433 [Rhodovulum adriaticum]
MEDHGKLSKHFWLTQGMARTLGVNVNDALKDGRMARGAYAELVAACCHCDRAESCMAWMGQQTAQADTLPDWCAIKPTLEALREPA